MNRTPPCRLLLLTALTLLLGAGDALAQRGNRFPEIETLIEPAIRKGDLPGAVICFADRDQVRYLKAFGDRRVLPERQPMTTDTVFDLASITKPVATATSIALLSQWGQIDVAKPVSAYLPEFTGNEKETITIQQCLLHTSGLIPDNSLADYQDGDQETWRRLCGLKLRSDPGTTFSYSDVGYIVLGKLVHRVSGKPLDEFADEAIFKALGMKETAFNPESSLRNRSAPTEIRDGDWLQGHVHDPRAARMGGVAGHAGLFSTAGDLVRYGQNLLAAAEGQSPSIQRTTFQRMTLPRETPRGSRTLGWDHRSPYSSNRGSHLSESAFGHGGFTGTVLWIDPEKELIFVFLSSRLHPDGKGSVNQLAGEIVTRVAQQW